MGRRSKPSVKNEKKKRAARKSSKKRKSMQLNLREEFKKLAIEELTAIEVKDHRSARQETDVSKPCCGDGARQEIKDSSNTSSNHSISDDILSGKEDVDTETLGSPSDCNRWCPTEEDKMDRKLFSSREDYECLYGLYKASERMRYEREEKSPNLEMEGGRQEIEDSSNTSRKQSISDDILSGDEDVDSETLGLPRDSLPWHILWGEWGVPEEEVDISEEYPDMYGPSEPLRSGWEENWPNLRVKMDDLTSDEDSMFGVEFDCMSPIPLPEAI